MMNDLDNIEPYPSNGDLEDKALFSLEQMRQNYYIHRKNFISSTEGGDLHHAVLMAYGPKSAASMDANTKASFEHYLKQAYLTPEGETTDPRYPTDKMIAHELRRIRQTIFFHVSHFFHQFEQMMPENMDDWNPTITAYNLTPYISRYSEGLHADINVVIPRVRMAPPSSADVTIYIARMAGNLSIPVQRLITYPGEDRITVINSARDDLIRFILKDLPFNNVKLANSTPLLADEIMRTETDAKPNLH